MIVLSFLEFSKDERVIMSTEFAVMSLVCACGGDMAAATEHARFSVRETRDSFKICLNQLKNVRFRVRSHEKQR
jgi:hypothetical protein